MRKSYVAFGGLMLTALVFGCSAPAKSNDNGTGGSGASAGSGGSGATAGSGGSGTGGTATGGSGGASGGAAGTGSGGVAGSGAGGSGGTPAGGITSCTDGVLFSGDPYFTGDLTGWNPNGQDKFADPPLRNMHIAISGQTVFYETNFEIWRTNGSNVQRVAGNEADQDPLYQPSGACSTVEFLNAKGFAALPNGNVVVADWRGGGLVELQTPTATCTAAPYAGNQTAIHDTDIAGDVANQGDQDGPGASAKFYGVRIPTADEQGNLYVDDSGNGKLKKIANDASHTVSTFYDYSKQDQVQILAMTSFGGKLYVAAANISNDYMWAFDAKAGGAPQVLYSGTGHYPEIDSNQEAIINGMTNDGVALIVTTAKGYIWRVGTDGTVLATLAGMGQIVDFPAGLNFKSPIPANQLPLHTIDLNTGSMVMSGSDILWAGAANGVGMYVLDIHCK